MSLTFTPAGCRLQALQEAADSVLTPRWQTQASTHQQPQRSGSFYLQPQAGIHEQPETGTHMQPPDTFSFSQQPAAALSSSQQPTAPFSFSQHPTAPFLSSQQPQQPLASDLQPQTDPRQQPQQPFSSSLQFQAAHDTDFQLAGGDRHQNLSMPVLPSKPSSDAAAADISSDQAAADHAADVKFAAGHMRSHEIGSSRSISNGKTAEQDAVAAVGGAGTFDTEVQQLGTSQGDAHDCAEAGPGRARGDVPLSVDSSSSSSSSGDDSCLSQAELQQTSVADSAPAQGQSVRSSRQGDTCSADKPLGSPVAVTDGRVLKPHNFADAAAAAGVDTADGAQPRVAGHAVEASKKSAGHAGRAVGLVGPTSPAHVASSLDVMIKTGHVVRSSCLDHALLVQFVAQTYSPHLIVDTCMQVQPGRHWSLQGLP